MFRQNTASFFDEHADLTSLANFVSDSNCNTVKGKASRNNFRHKLTAMNDGKCVHSKVDLLKCYEEMTREASDVFIKNAEVCLRNNFIKWCDEDCYITPKHMIMSISNLKCVCKLKGISDCSKKGKDDLIKTLVHHDKTSNISGDKNLRCVEMLESKMLHDIFMSSYLKPISNERAESKHTKLGHTNEKKLVKNFMKDADSLNELFGFIVFSMCEVGTVMSKFHEDLKKQ